MLGVQVQCWLSAQCRCTADLPQHPPKPASSQHSCGFACTSLGLHLTVTTGEGTRWLPLSRSTCHSLHQLCQGLWCLDSFGGRAVGHMPRSAGHGQEIFTTLQIPSVRGPEGQSPKEATTMMTSPGSTEKVLQRQQGNCQTLVTLPQTAAAGEKGESGNKRD